MPTRTAPAPRAAQIDHSARHGGPYDQPPSAPYRRLGERSPRPLASLSVTVEIEVAQVRIRTESSVTNAREATVGPRQVPPVQRPAMHGYVRARPGALYAANEDVPAEGR